MKISLLKNAKQAGLYQLPASHAGDLLDMARKAHQTLLVTDVGNCKTSHEVLSALGRAFHFPAWYGANLDALHDCLTDPAWQSGKGVILKISGLDVISDSIPDFFSLLLEVLRAAATTRSAEIQPLWILLPTPAAGVPLFPDA